MTTIPKTLPAEVNDRLMAVMDQVISNLMIQLELTFEHELDAERLEQATRLCLDAEPVLGCRFVGHASKPCWERCLPEQHRSILHVDDQASYLNYQNQPLLAQGGPQLEVCLLRSPAGDKVLLKIGHAAADAAAVKQIAERLCAIYGALDENPSHQPDINLKGARTIRQITTHLPWRYYPRLLFQVLLAPLELLFYPPTHKLFRQAAAESIPSMQYVQRFIDSERVDRLRTYGHQHKATLNDMFMAAFLRALSRTDWDHEDHLKMACTVDLRRYHPEGRCEGICNMSEMVYLGLGTDPGLSFEDAVARLAATSTSLKRRYIGLKELFSKFLINLVPYGVMEKKVRQLTEKSRSQPTKHTRSPPNLGLTNMGPIDPAVVTLDRPPVNAVLLPPPIFPPGFTAGLSGYDGSLTLTAGTAVDNRERTDAFFEALLQELPG